MQAQLTGRRQSSTSIFGCFGNKLAICDVISFQYLRPVYVTDTDTPSGGALFAGHRKLLRNTAISNEIWAPKSLLPKCWPWLCSLTMKIVEYSWEWKNEVFIGDQMQISISDSTSNLYNFEISSFVCGTQYQGSARVSGMVLEEKLSRR